MISSFKQNELSNTLKRFGKILSYNATFPRYKLDFLSTTSEPKESISESDIDITVTLRNFFEDPNSSQNDVFSYIDVSYKNLSAEFDKLIGRNTI